MKAAAGGRRGFLQGMVGEQVSDFANQTRRGKRLLQVVALKVNIGIDLVGNSIVALVPFESDVMSRSAYPERFSMNLIRSFPDAQVVAGLYHANGFGVRPAVVLRTAKQIELAHGHGHIGLFRNAFKNAVEDRILDVGIHLYPASGSENLLHGRFRAKNKKIDHITRMALLVRDTPRDFGEKSTVDAGDGAELLGHGVRLAVFRSVHLNLHDIGAAAGIVACLVDSERQVPGNGRNHIAVRANQEGLRHVFVADAPDQSAASRFVKRQDAQEITKAPGKTVGPIVFFGFGVAQLTDCGNDHVFARLHVDAGIHPGRVAGKLYLLRKALLPQGCLGFHTVLPGSRLLAWRGGALAN